MNMNDPLKPNKSRLLLDDIENDEDLLMNLLENQEAKNSLDVKLKGRKDSALFSKQKAVTFAENYHDACDDTEKIKAQRNNRPIIGQERIKYGIDLDEKRDNKSVKTASFFRSDKDMDHDRIDQLHQQVLEQKRFLSDLNEHITLLISQKPVEKDIDETVKKVKDEIELALQNVFKKEKLAIEQYIHEFTLKRLEADEDSVGANERLAYERTNASLNDQLKKAQVGFFS